MNIEKYLVLNKYLLSLLGVSDFKDLKETGSGKTLILHINYYQFFHYTLFSPDNIILITPNEGLSKQHYEEIKKSGIPCQLYLGSLSSLSSITADKEVIVMCYFWTKGIGLKN